MEISFPSPRVEWMPGRGLTLPTLPRVPYRWTGGVTVTVPFGRLGRSALEEAEIVAYVSERLAKDGRGAVRVAALHLLGQCADMVCGALCL
jgi:hypothetical protein